MSDPLPTITPTCPNGFTPPFPGLYIPERLDSGGQYICSVYHAWLFTVLWTLIMYAAFYLAAAGYAFLIQVGNSASGSHSGSTPKSAVKETSTVPAGLKGKKDAGPSGSVSGGSVTGNGSGTGNASGVEGLVQGARRNWRITLIVGVAYIVVGGIEAVLAGSIVGVILGTVYDAGIFRLSTWVPLVWAVINVIFLILSSFSIQERLL